MADLDTYMLQLKVGGNDADNSEVVATLGTNSSRVADGQVVGVIAADVAGSVENGFYFKMTSTTNEGNTVINYSYRFTLINMNGTTPSIALDGANAAQGSDDVPSSQYNVITGPAVATGPSAAITTTATATATATATSTDSDDEDDSDSLSLGARIGIGAGVILALVGAVSIVAWAFMLYRYKKKKKREHEQAENTLEGGYPPKDTPRAVSQYGKAELPGHSKASSQDTIPMSPMGLAHEAPEDTRPVEAARASIYELDSGWDGWEAGNGRKSEAYDPTSVI